MRPKVKLEARVPTLSGKEALILGLLLKAPSSETYGLELVGRSANMLKRGTVYVTLNRMENKGYIESRQEEQQANISGAPRRLYRVTGYGEKIYEAWQLAREALRARSLSLGGAA
jgi:DNA-binding PadR family transcriptional regulator